jgi:hypothetical protein
MSPASPAGLKGGLGRERDAQAPMRAAHPGVGIPLVNASERIRWPIPGVAGVREILGLAS